MTHFFFKFNFVGAFITLIAYLVYSGLIYLGFNYTIALVFDYVVGVILGLFLHHKYTFKNSDRLNKVVIVKAIFSNVVIFFINVATLYVLIDLYKNNEYLSQIISLVIIAVCSFLFYRFYIFDGLK